MPPLPAACFNAADSDADLQAAVHATLRFIYSGIQRDVRRSAPSAAAATAAAGPAATAPTAGGAPSFAVASRPAATGNLVAARAATPAAIALPSSASLSTSISAAAAAVPVAAPPPVVTPQSLLAQVARAWDVPGLQPAQAQGVQQEVSSCRAAAVDAAALCGTVYVAQRIATPRATPASGSPDDVSGEESEDDSATDSEDDSAIYSEDDSEDDTEDSDESGGGGGDDARWRENGGSDRGAVAQPRALSHRSATAHTKATGGSAGGGSAASRRRMSVRERRRLKNLQRAAGIFCPSR